MKLKISTKESLAWIADAIDKWDPIKLFPFAPDDEYEPEINEIAKSLHLVESIIELGILIKSVFVHHFGDNVEIIDQECYEVAVKIWKRCGE